MNQLQINFYQVGRTFTVHTTVVDDFYFEIYVTDSHYFRSYQRGHILTNMQCKAFSSMLTFCKASTEVSYGNRIVFL